MKRGVTTELDGIEFRPSTGRLRLSFRVDNFRHVINCIYHDPPDLPPAFWRAVHEEMALACLVDISTASLSREVRCKFFEPGARGRRVFQSAAEALRLEMLAEHELPLNLLPLRLYGTGRARRIPKEYKPDTNRVLLLMGGGKDSLYTYQLLRRAGYEVVCFYVTLACRTWQQLRRVYAALDQDVQQYRVFLDANRRDKLDQRYGSLYLSQYEIGQHIAGALPYAIAHRCRYLALGLERSSDAPMTYYRGKPVNHQHQKSSSFIRQLNRHLLWRFNGALEIVSPLHGLYDMGIYARFLETRELVTLQSSCGGANSYVPHCGRCEKCAFLAALLAGLSGDRQLYEMLFPRDPLRDARLYDVWLKSGAERPLACVGFVDEVRLSLALANQRDWHGGILDEWDGIAPNDETLLKFLSLHPNALVSREMNRRIEPLLHRSTKDLARQLSLRRPR